MKAVTAVGLAGCLLVLGWAAAANIGWPVVPACVVVGLFAGMGYSWWADQL